MTAFLGAARPITATQVAIAANAFGIELAALRAVMAVESRNSGYDAQRRPIILFEPHVFYRNLSGAARDRAVLARLAYARWGQEPYPSSSNAQYARLALAIRIDEEAAYRSISMGLGQVLGENFHAAKCSSAKEMFEQAAESEANQLHHMLNFIGAEYLLKPLRDHDWERFARGYNGRGQVKKYAAWLAREYAKWARILAKPREELTAQDLKDAGSKTIIATDTAKKAVATATVAGPAAGVALETAKQMVEPVTQAVQTAQSAKSAWDWFHENWEFMLVIGLTGLFLIACWYAWRAIQTAEDVRVQNARDGINTRF
jgi:hypothetical protein